MKLTVSVVDRSCLLDVSAQNSNSDESLVEKSSAITSVIDMLPFVRVTDKNNNKKDYMCYRCVTVGVCYGRQLRLVLQMCLCYML